MKDSLPNGRYINPSPERGRHVPLLWRTFLENGAFLLDTETTSLPPCAEVLDIAIVDANGWALINQLLCPWDDIHPDACAVHGWNNWELQDYPVWDDRHARIEYFLSEGTPVLAWNAPFDSDALLYTAQLHSCEWSKFHPLQLHDLLRDYRDFMVASHSDIGPKHCLLYTSPSPRD